MLTSERITITLKGSHAARGVSLSNFETFIENFLGALRAFQREEAGVPASKTGTPEKAAVIATAFRLVQLEPGSAVVTLEPEPLRPLDEESERMFEHEPPQVTNLRTLLERIDQRAFLPETVTVALAGACRALGDDASIDLIVPGVGTKPQAGLIDSRALAELATAEATSVTRRVDSVSGSLHRLDLEPDKIGIRAADGVEWTCDYPPELESKIIGLMGQVVWASGDGELQRSRRGVMELDGIESAEAQQSALFSKERVSDQELAARQGIDRPQGLESLGVTEWTDEDDAYLAALTEE